MKLSKLDVRVEYVVDPEAGMQALPDLGVYVDREGGILYLLQAERAAELDPRWRPGGVEAPVEGSTEPPESPGTPVEGDGLGDH